MKNFVSALAHHFLNLCETELMRVLITRPLADAKRLAHKLKDKEIDSVVAPMLEIRIREDRLPTPEKDLQAILLTSANGARALAAGSADRNIPIFAVGDATAITALELGFKTVKSSGGDAEALAAKVIANYDPSEGSFLHVAGRQATGDLSGRLQAAGFNVKKKILYEAVPVTTLSESARLALEGGILDAALFFSPRSAAGFVKVLRSGGFIKCCRRLDALCLSRAVADNLSGIAWRGIFIAQRPDQEALLELMGINS